MTLVTGAALVLSTWKGVGNGRYLANGAVSHRGALAFSSSSPALQRLNAVAGAFEFEVDAGGNTHSKIWGWKLSDEPVRNSSGSRRHASRSMRSVATARLTSTRRLVAGALCVFVQAFVLVSPLVHAHPVDHHDDHDEDHHHAGTHQVGSIHAHLGGHSHAHQQDGSPAFEEEHARAVYLPLFISEPLTAFDLPAVSPQTFAAGVPDETAGHLAAAVTHGHDPPLSRSTPPRAPPVSPAFI